MWHGSAGRRRNSLSGPVFTDRLGKALLTVTARLALVTLVISWVVNIGMALRRADNYLRTSSEINVSRGLLAVRGTCLLSAFSACTRCSSSSVWVPAATDLLGPVPSCATGTPGLELSAAQIEDLTDRQREQW